MRCPQCKTTLCVDLHVKPKVKRKVKLNVEPKVESNVKRLGGIEGGDSAPVLSFDSDPDVGKPNPNLVVNPNRARARGGRPSTVEYSDEFESFWSRCHGKKGNKAPAFNSFVKLKPPVELAVQRWSDWMATDQWQRGYSQHMVTWLNERGWESEPDPSEYGGRANGATLNNRGAAERFLERHGGKP